MDSDWLTLILGAIAGKIAYDKSQSGGNKNPEDENRLFKKIEQARKANITSPFFVSSQEIASAEGRGKTTSSAKVHTPDEFNAVGKKVGGRLLSSNKGIRNFAALVSSFG